MTGRPPCENPRKQRCRHCGRKFTNAGITSHERNCEWEQFEGYHPSVDDAEIVDEEGDPPSTSNPPHPEGEGKGPTPSEGDPPSQESQNLDTPESGGDPSTVTDGGPQTPPTPDVGADHAADPPGDDGRDAHAQKGGDPSGAGEQREPEDLPDRYVAVDTYVATVRERDPDDVDVDELEALLDGYDVVDLEQTDEDSIGALMMEEVPA